MTDTLVNEHHDPIVRALRTARNKTASKIEADQVELNVLLYSITDRQRTAERLTRALGEERKHLDELDEALTKRLVDLGN